MNVAQSRAMNCCIDIKEITLAFSLNQQHAEYSRKKKKRAPDMRSRMRGISLINRNRECTTCFALLIEHAAQLTRLFVRSRKAIPK